MNRKESAYGYRVEFALQYDPYTREYNPQYWILRHDQDWHDAVRGDGGSYMPGGPADFEGRPNETLEQLESRALRAMRNQ